MVKATFDEGCSDSPLRQSDADSSRLTAPEIHRVKSGIKSAVIVGGGLAGLACAVRLREAGVRVTLVEARNRLGGRATSFTDARTGAIIDNCQHVVLGCCTNLLDFYRRVGVDRLIKWHQTLYFASRGRKRADQCLVDVLAPGVLPAPLHLAGGFLRFQAFPLMHKLQLARAMQSIITIDDAHARRLNMTFGQWLRTRAQQEESVIHRLWNVIIVSACNLDVDRVDAWYALKVFREGFLANRRAFEMGVASCPLMQLYDPVQSMIDDLRLRTRITGIRLEESAPRITGVRLENGAMIEADACILALPPDTLSNLLPRSRQSIDPRFGQADRLEFSPILGVHLRFGAPVSDLPHIAMLDHEVQWFFFKESGRHVHAVISSADAWMNLRNDEIVRLVLADLATLRPRHHNLAHNMTGFRVVKEKRATFAATVGSRNNRPSTTGAIRNLYFAGDYCDTGWPATMEGAVRSGYLAAAAALGLPEQQLLSPELPAAKLFSVISLIPVI